jgi:hypothetical protein
MVDPEKDSATLKAELEKIYDRFEQLTPQLVVRLAENESHPLHSRFEWDDTEAAVKYREHQAGELIRSVKITFRKPDGDTGRVRAFHAVPTESGRTYRPMVQVQQDPIAREILLQQAKRDWEAMKKRYQDLSEFFAYVSESLEVLQ